MSVPKPEEGEMMQRRSDGDLVKVLGVRKCEVRLGYVYNLDGVGEVTRKHLFMFYLIPGSDGPQA